MPFKEHMQTSADPNIQQQKVEMMSSNNAQSSFLLLKDETWISPHVNSRTLSFHYAYINNLPPRINTLS
jgi:hypothetical protein